MNAARLAAARAAPALRRPARSFTVLETMARPVANMPNKIAEYRTPYVQNLHLHGADNPTYLKGDGDKTQVAVGFALLGFALLQVTRGLYNMSNFMLHLRWPTLSEPPVPLGRFCVGGGVFASPDGATWRRARRRRLTVCGLVCDGAVVGWIEERWRARLAPKRARLARRACASRRLRARLVGGGAV